MKKLMQGCGSGSAWIRIHFPCWIRILIQEGKFVNQKLNKCKEIANNFNFIKFFKSKFAQAPLFFMFEQSYMFLQLKRKLFMIFFFKFG